MAASIWTRGSSFGFCCAGSIGGGRDCPSPSPAIGKPSSGAGLPLGKCCRGCRRKPTPMHASSRMGNCPNGASTRKTMEASSSDSACKEPVGVCCCAYGVVDINAVALWGLYRVCALRHELGAVAGRQSARLFLLWWECDKCKMPVVRGISFFLQ